MLLKVNEEGRTLKNELLRQRNLILNNNILVDSLNGINIYVLILNNNKEILFANREILKILNLELDDILGMKPGEIVNCKNAVNGEEICGNAKECKNCSAKKLYEYTKNTGKSTVGNIDFISVFEGIELKNSYNKKVSELDFGEDKFYQFSIQYKNVNAEKSEMDRVFLHDILNAATGLYNTIRLLQMKNDKFKNDNEIHLLESYIMSIIDDIEYQRNISRAEKDDLKPKFLEFDIGILCNEIVELLKQDERYYKINIIQKFNRDINIVKTDKSLIRRIIINLIKNALEANENNSDIRLTLEFHSNIYKLSIHNDEVISEEIKKRLFERGNSSKGKGHGFGLYGTKFILKKYLRGDIYYSSEANIGTTFTIEIPKEVEV